MRWLPTVQLLFGLPFCVALAGTATAETADEFTARMTNVELVGQFTMDRPDLADAPPRRDRYRIGSIEKVRDNTFRVNAKIKYKKLDGSPVDLTVPILVQVDFPAGTPVLSVTDLKIPLLGEDFGARVLFDGDRYAGTWSHGDVGGHMWGKIEAADEDSSDTTTESAE